MRRVILLLAVVWTVQLGAQALGPPQVITIVDSGTACVTSRAACAIFDVNTSTSAAFNVSGTWTGTLTFEGTADGGNWNTILMTKTVDGSTATTTTANGTFAVPNAGFQQVRARATATITGNATVSATRGYATAKLGGGTLPTGVATGSVLVSNGVGASPAYSASPTVTSLTATSFGSFGSNPGASGMLRMGNGLSQFVGRNAANSGDLTILGIDGSNQLSVGDSNLVNVLINSAAAGGLVLHTVTFATLGSSATNGTINYCSDCAETTPASCPVTQASCICAGSGSGAFARRVNATWYCTF